MEFKKVIGTVVLGFVASFGMLNSEFIGAELKNLAGSIGIINNESGISEEEIAGDAKLFPISGGKVAATKKTISETVTHVVPVKASYQLSISAIGISDVPIIFEPTTYENRIYSALERGVVHYAKTPSPGESGTSIIIGHSSAYPWYKGKYGSIFSNLSKLKTGDVISVEKNGKVLNYTIAKSLIFSPESADDFELRELEATSGSSIVLMTCWPTGTNAKRIAVRADLAM